MLDLPSKEGVLDLPAAPRCVECGHVLIKNVNWLISSKKKPCHDCQLRMLDELTDAVAKLRWSYLGREL